MLKTQCIPFYSDNNSSNLPFYLLHDRRGNDVIYINEKNIIYTNQKNSEINEQLNLYEKCFNRGICYSYKINKQLSVIKKQIGKDIYWYLLNGNDQLGIYQTKYDNLEDIRIHFNNKYFCLASTEYGDCIPNIVAGYDINKKQLLDCSDYKTENILYKYLVEARRCQFDCICSILSGKMFIEDEDRLFYFLSFIFDKQINQHNYKEYLSIARNYILQKYPKLKNLKIPFDKLKIQEQNKNFGINYFYFNRIDKNIDDLKYFDNKNYVKTKNNIC